MLQGPIGVFDSGYGGLTVLKEIVEKLPQYDYLYLGDNARAPYGSRSYHTIYEYTLQSVRWFFEQGCSLVILACNTASAKALRTIQQHDLPSMDPEKRVLGVIRPTTEKIGALTASRKIGVLGTKGTVQSESYKIEINKFFGDVEVYQQACPLLVPLIENGEHQTDGADFFIKKYLENLFSQSPAIDTVLLACTHYPLIQDKIKSHLPASINVVAQGGLVADSLSDYLQRHPKMEENCSKGNTVQFFTTDAPEDFDSSASIFYNQPVRSRQVVLS